MKRVAVFGEMLWDCPPSEKIAGGAPMNVAMNLHKLGANSRLISAVGSDDDGKELLEIITQTGLNTDLVQIKQGIDTSRVLVDDSDKENIKYDIVKNVAWDYINLRENQNTAVSYADAIVFGSLGVRSLRSYQTLTELLKLSKQRIFDINLRPPFLDFEKIEFLLSQTDLLKVNEEEVEILADHFGLETDFLTVSQFLFKRYKIKLICITLGSKGAQIISRNKTIEHPGYQTDVGDTIGAGDAFLSGFIFGWLNGAPLEHTLDFASKLGAFVASQKGANPSYTYDSIAEFNPPKN